MTDLFAFAGRYWVQLAVAVVISASLLTAGIERSRRKDVQAEFATYRADQERAARAETDRLTRERDALATRLSTIDAEATAALRKAQNENATLRNRLAAGTVGLRVKAVCAASGERPSTAQGGRLDTGTTAVLDPSVRQDYLDLRSNITGTESKLSACQRSLKEFDSPPS